MTKKILALAVLGLIALAGPVVADDPVVASTR